MDPTVFRVGRRGLALLVFAHGVAHSAGFFLPWRSAAEGVPFDTTVFGGRGDLGTAGMLILGVLYLAAAIAFVISAISISSNLVAWARWTIGVTVFSLILTVPGWPATQIGVYLNLVLLAVLMVASWRGPWLPKGNGYRVKERPGHPIT